MWRQLRKPARKVATLPPERTGLAHWLFEAPWHPFLTATLISVIAIITYPLSKATGRHAGLGMGVGASWAGGCTIGNAMVETAQFSFQGWISFLFMFCLLYTSDAADDLTTV